MINDESYANRLNAIKKGEDIPEQKNPEYKWGPQSPKEFSKLPIYKEILIDIYKNLTRTLGVLMASALYGFGIEAILRMDWEVLQILGIGLIANHIVTIFPVFLKKLFSKNSL